MQGATTAKAGNELTLTVGGTGVPTFDVMHGKLAELMTASLSNTPTWELISMVYATEDTGRSASMRLWSGVITLDAEGYLVWYTQQKTKSTGTNTKTEISPFLALENSHSMLYGTWNNGADDFPGPAMDDVSSNETLYSEFYQVDYLGAVAKKYKATCTSDTDLNAWAMHEMRPDTHYTAGDAVVMSGFSVHKASGFELDGGKLSASYAVAGLIGRWVPEENRMTTLIDTWHKFQPAIVRGLMLTNGSADSVTTECGSDSHHAIDWMHMSSVAAGSSASGANYVASMRNINTIASFLTKSGGTDETDYEVEWILAASTDISSPYPTYEYASKADAAYWPHHVTQLPSTNIIVMDNGAARPGCAGLGSGIGCYSRAIEYELNARTMKAVPVWQFAWPIADAEDPDDDGVSPLDAQRRDVGDTVGNSVVRLSNNHTLVSFTSLSSLGGGDDDDESDDSSTASVDALFLEAAWDGGLHAGFVMKDCGVWAEGAYRGIPQSSIFGESSSSPFDALATATPRRSGDDDSVER